MPLVSVRDVATVATTVLLEDVEKHAGAIYELTSVMISANDRAQLLSKVLSHLIMYKQISVADQYQFLVDQIHLLHLVAYGLASDIHSGGGRVTTGMPICLVVSQRPWNNGLFQ